MRTLLNEANYMRGLFPHHPGKKLQSDVTQHCFRVDDTIMIRMIDNIIITKHVVNINVTTIMVTSRNVSVKLKNASMKSFVHSVTEIGPGPGLKNALG